MKTTDLVGSKSLLAKLMASENITVRHAKRRTASFDTKSRVLTCPMWTDMTGVIYDLLMGHEVGHALYTPAAGWHDEIFRDGKYCGEKFKSFLNVIEDARIEKLIKRKYPGLRKTFVLAYAELYSRDFFEVKRFKGNYSSFNLIDRMNLHFKIGASAMVQFSSAEQVLVDEVAKTETWDQVVTVTKKVWDYVIANEKKKIRSVADMHSRPATPVVINNPKQPDEDSNDDASDFDDANEEESEQGYFEEDDQPESKDDEEYFDETDYDDDDVNIDVADPVIPPEVEDKKSEETPVNDFPVDGSVSKDDEEKSDESDLEDENSDNLSSKGGEKTDIDEVNEEQKEFEPVSATDQAFRTNEEGLINEKASTYLFMDLPKVNIENAIFDNETFIKEFDEEFNKFFETQRNNLVNNALMYDRKDFEIPKMDVKVVATKLAAEFNSKNRSYISLLVQEFEMRKNANEYARQRISKTGELDTRKLANYKFTSDIFRKIAQVDKGKSHGMMIYVDFSGSMLDCISEIIEQTLILVSFCKKVNIPFAVYTFTDGRSKTIYDEVTWKPIDEKPIFVKTTADQFSFYDSSFHLNELISSRLSQVQFKKAFNALLIMSAVGSYNAPIAIKKIFHPYECGGLIYNLGFKLGGTPFNEMLVTSRYMVDDFKKTSQADIVTVIHLTDGEGSASFDYPDYYNNLNWTDRSSCSKGFRDPITKQKILVGNRSEQAALTELVSQVTGCRHIGYYFGNHKSLMHTFKRSREHRDQISDIRRSLLTEGFCVMPSLGYDSYYYISLNVFKQDIGELSADGEGDLTKSKLLKIFNTHQTRKKNNRVVVTKFASEIAKAKI